MAALKSTLQVISRSDVENGPSDTSGINDRPATPTHPWPDNETNESPESKHSLSDSEADML